MRDFIVQLHHPRLRACLVITAGLLAVAAVPDRADSGPAATTPEEVVIATVGDAAITGAEFQLAYQLGEEIDYSLEESALRRDLIDRLISRKLLVQEARRRRLERTGSMSRFIRELEQKLANDELKNRIYGDTVEVTEEEIRELYERYHYTFQVYHLSVDNRARAEELHRRLLEGEDYGDLALRYSEDRNTGDKGGDMGEITAGFLVIEFEDAVFDLEPGEISEVIKGKGEHYKIFKLISMRRDREPEQTYAELHAALTQRVRIREGGAALYAWQLELFETREFVIIEPNYERFADHLRDNIASWEAVYSMDADSLSEGWIFSAWPDDLRRLEIARFQGGRVTVAEFLKLARDMPHCPTCLWRDSDVQLRQQVKGMGFDKMYETVLRDIRLEKLPWIQQELGRRREDRLVDMISALMNVQPDAITDAEARAYHESQEETPMMPPKARALRIVVETEAQAWDIWERLQGGADFKTLANRFSIDARTNFRGGETDQFGPGTLEGMADVALEYEPGDMIQPFETRAGWEIVQVTEKVPARPATFAETRASAKKVLARERTYDDIMKLIAELRESTPIEIDEQMLATVPLVSS